MGGDTSDHIFQNRFGKLVVTQVITLFKTGLRKYREKLDLGANGVLLPGVDSFPVNDPCLGSFPVRKRFGFRSRSWEPHINQLFC